DAEFIMGTDPKNPDTDGDGIFDSAEVKQGTDPASGRAVRTGIIAAADTTGTASDICALNDLAVIADRADGISVFNVFNGMSPTLIAQVDTPGQAQAVACAGNFIAVADGTAGLAIVDVSDPATARIVHQLSLGSDAVAVTAAGLTAYVGLSNGGIAAVDLISGTVLDQIKLGSPIQDVAIGGDTLYALVVGKLHAIPLGEGGLQAAGAVDSPGVIGAGRRRLRLLAGDRVLYATYTSGFNIFNISNPAQPAFVRTVATPQFGWKQIVANGSGVGLAAVGPNSTDDGPHDVSLYNLGPDGTGGEFQATFETPGLAAAVSIYNGIAYVADSAAGLQVVNYLAFDTRRVPPTISLSTSFSTGSAEEGKLMRVTAHAADDVQVRNVEFYVDGVKVSTDGNFPFEHRFVTPLVAPERSSFTIRGRASDTGGNQTWSEELTIQLVRDATPPRVRRTTPFNGALVGAVRNVTAFLSEPIERATINSDSVRVVSAGADGVQGTGDDSQVNGALEYRDGLNAVLFLPPDRLLPGSYRLRIAPPLSDLAGNAIAAALTADFRVFSFVDEDQDGLPDEIEASLGLDPTKADSNGNGILDGLEDFDRDGLVNAGEVFAETDPVKPDTNGNGIPDGAEDPDQDGLSNAREFAAGTNPLVADSDGDGWNDETEVTSASDPLDPGARPRLFFASRAAVDATVISQTVAGFITAGSIIGRPPFVAHLFSLTSVSALPPGSYVARPPVTVIRFSVSSSEDPARIIIGRPPVDIRINQ
ncbi:MAG: Ig-like domain-containing protein, partial [Verrucomicrobiales bacterium]|nr:Ig-like domain-containing protein [Verrucomicrobiales bacterium]